MKREMHTQKTSDAHCVSPATTVVDDAVGVAETQWFVAIVTHNTETSAALKLSDLSIEAFAAVQPETRIWRNGRRHTANRIVIPSVVFFRSTETQRRQIVNLPFISRCLSDRANAKPVATIPDSQIQLLRFMLGHSETPVEFLDHQYCVGQQVKVTRGRLLNAEGSIVHLPNGRGELVIALGALGGAKCTISLSDIQPLLQ